MNLETEQAEAPSQTQESLPSQSINPDDLSSSAGSNASNNEAPDHKTTEEPVHSGSEYHPALEDWTGSQ